MSTTDKPAGTLPQSEQELQHLLARAQRGDESTLPVVKQIVETGALDEEVGNLALKASRVLIERATGRDLVSRESVSHKLDGMRREIEGDSPMPLERLLAERIALCWLSLHEAEIRFAQAKEVTFQQATYWQDRIDRAHRRYLSANKTLATVRKLALPALQVNIAKKQVNIAGGTA